MTRDADGWAGPGTVVPGLLGAAAPHLQHAEDRVGEALRTVVAADAVAWSSEASAGYRADLADGAGMLRAVRNQLADATTVAAKHDVAVQLARQTTPQLGLKNFREFFSGPTAGPALEHGR